MIPSNFSTEEVLKLNSISIEEFKEYISNQEIEYLTQEISNLHDTIWNLKDEISNLNIELSKTNS